MPRAKAYAPDLHFKQVEKYVRQAPARLLPRGWSQWSKGVPPSEHKLESIDDELARLSSKRKRILSADEVRARHPQMNWPSHEIAIRLQLLWYVNFEFLDSIMADAEVAQFHRKQLSLLESAEAPLLEFLRLINARSTVRFYPQVERELISNAQSAIQLVGKLTNRINSCLRGRRPLDGGKPSPQWKRLFVLRLAAFWYVITDLQPSTSTNSPFAKFVSAAWNSLHDDIPGVSWDYYLRHYSQRATAKEAIEIVNSAGTLGSMLWADRVFCQNPLAI